MTSDTTDPINDINNNSNEPITDEQYKQYKQNKLKLKQQTKLSAEAHKLNQRGIVYISSIPNKMQPQTIKQLLSSYNNAAIHRIYCQPIDNQKQHGSKHISYLHGWIEFDNKHVAKQLCNMLNNQPIGGNKRNPYYDCIWNIKYLTGFKWYHLTDKLHSDRAAHASMTRDKMEVARIETENYYKTVSHHKYNQRKQRRNELNGDSNDNDSDKQNVQYFKQRKMLHTSQVDDND